MDYEYNVKIKYFIVLHNDDDDDDDDIILFLFVLHNFLCIVPNHPFSLLCETGHLCISDQFSDLHPTKLPQHCFESVLYRWTESLQK